MADGYTREWKFRAWNPTENKMFSPEDLEEPDTAEDAPKTIYGGLIDGALHIKDYKTDPVTEYIFQQSTNWFDQEQNEIYEGDIVEIDGKYYQVIWDEVSGGYLFLGEDMDVSPGGAYITDFVKIVGNVFENSKADPEEHRRSIKFRAWDPVSNIMYTPEDIKDPQEDMMVSIYAYLSFGALYIYDFKLDPPIELIPMQYTGWKDAEGFDIFEGDVVYIDEDEERKAQVSWSDEIGQFIFVDDEGTIYPGSMSTSEQTKLIGNIYENKEFALG